MNHGDIRPYHVWLRNWKMIQSWAVGHPRTKCSILTREEPTTRGCRTTLWGYTWNWWDTLWESNSLLLKPWHLDSWFTMIYPWKMVIFHSYVRLPEGTGVETVDQFFRDFNSSKMTDSSASTNSVPEYPMVYHHLPQWSLHLAVYLRFWPKSILVQYT